MRTKEIVWSLQTYEFSLLQPKKKRLALRSYRKKKVVEFSKDDLSTDEAEALLARKSKRFLKFNMGSRNPKVDAVKGYSQEDTQGKKYEPKKDINS